jgi:hypothetical protein
MDSEKPGLSSLKCRPMLLAINSTMKRWLFVAAALIFLLVGCGPDIRVQEVDPEYRPPNSGQLDVYNSAQEVKRPYKTIKILQAVDDRVGRNQDEEELKNKIFAKAKEFGADGLIITKTGTQPLRQRDGMGGSVTHDVLYIDVEAIIYLDK